MISASFHAQQVQALSKQVLHRAVGDLRRSAAARSFQAFAQMYLPGHFKQAPSSMHIELFSLLQDAVETRAQRIAIAAPRGHAKTTIVSQAYVLWCICFKKEPFVLLISNTIDQASDCLSMIKHELQTNPLLMADFPDACEPPEATPTAPRWRKEEIITRNGVKVTALGAEKKIRGRKHHQHRPTLIILDDVENETEVRSPEQRLNKMEWFHKAVLKAGSSLTNIVVAGTILHYDSLLATLLNPAKSSGWIARKYQAVVSWAERQDLWERFNRFYTRQEELPDDKTLEGQRSGPRIARIFFDTYKNDMLRGSVVLWPEREDYYALMVQRLVEGRASFDSEKQNEPVNPEDCYFQESDLVYWDDRFPTIEALVEALERANPKCRMSIYGACDPSLGRHASAGSRAGDYSAIVTIARDSVTGTLYVLDADIKRRKPDQLIEDIFEYHRLRRYSIFGIEANQFQQLLCDMIRQRARERGLNVRVRDITNSADKHGRIQRLQALIGSGRLQFSKRHSMLLEQLRQFPMGAHDDGPDALEMAVRLTERQWIFDAMRHAGVFGRVRAP